MGTALQENVELGLKDTWATLPISEVVKQNPKVVPDLYIRRNDERPKSSDFSLSSPIDELTPVIDFSLLANGDEEELRKFDAAFQEWSMFQIINHGEEVCMEKMKKLISHFFNLPLTEKSKYKRARDDLNGYGVDYVTSKDFTKEWNDIFALFTLPNESRDMKYWPVDIMPDFKEIVEDYTSKTEMMADEILMKLSLLMGLEKGSLKRLHGERKMFVRMNHYPPCALPDLVLGSSAHSDSSSITILIQDDDVTALQVKHNDAWVSVKPIPNALIVLLGDCMEAWSNGKYKSIEHRVIANTEKERVSIAAFILPGDKVKLNPFKEMIDDDLRPKAYKDGVEFMEFLNYHLSVHVKGKEDSIGYIKI